MKIKNKVVAASVAAALLIVGVATPASAQSGSFGATDCDGGQHAFVWITSKGTQSLSIKGTNNQTNSYAWPGSTDSRRNWLNSPTGDSMSSSASTSQSSWEGAGSGCSW